MIFAEGIEVCYREFYGTIRFICENYITICIRKFKDRSKDVCILVYPNEYNKVILVKESNK